MKFPVLFIITSLLSFSGLKAQDDYEEQFSLDPGDVSMRISSKNGLNLRAQPGVTAKLLTTIPYGTSVWVRSSARHPANIDGKTGHWVRVDYEKFKGWAFDGYLDSRELQIKPAFKDFKGGCTGVGCNACGAMVFDPDGYFIHSHKCHERNAKLGKWSVEGGALRVCLGVNCNPASTKSIYIILMIDKSGKMYLLENGEKSPFGAPWVKWEPGGWPEATGRNRSLVPLD